MSPDLSRKRQSRRDTQLRHLSQSAQLEESVSPAVVRTTLTIATLSIAMFLVWAGFTNINEVASATGEIVPEGLPQTVQHLEGGLVSSIHVSDGDIVHRGDPLLRLDPASLREDRAAVAARLTAQHLEAERLRAFVEDRTPDFGEVTGATPSAVSDNRAFFRAMSEARKREEQVIHEQITQRENRLISLKHDEHATASNLKIVERLFQTRRKLNAKGLSSLVQLLEDEARLNDIRGRLARLQNDMIVARNEMAEFENRLSALSAQHRDQASARLSEVLAAIDENAAELQKIDDRMLRLTIRAPTDGLVKGLAINTLGAVIAPGDALMEIVPIGRDLEALVEVSPRDVGHVAVGLPVNVKLTSFDFSRYGTVPGTVTHISASTFVSPQGDPYFRARVALSKKHVGSKDRVILPGMMVIADILTGEKTILQYLLKPVHVSLETALREN